MSTSWHKGLLNVSTGHRKLRYEEVAQVAAECEKAWQDPSIPDQQLNLAMAEIASYQAGKPQPHFDILLKTLKKTALVNPSLLDVGAASGYYREIIRIGGFDCQYTGIDYSEACRNAGRLTFPGITLDVGDARALPYPDSWYDIVLSGCCLVHIRDYDKVIYESARVAKRFVILNRTPIVMDDVPTQFYEKEAYGVRTIEIHFNETELFAICRQAGLNPVAWETIFVDRELRYAHKTYLMKKAA